METFGTNGILRSTVALIDTIVNIYLGLAYDHRLVTRSALTVNVILNR